MLDASTAVLGALVRRRPRPALESAFEQALTVVSESCSSSLRRPGGSSRYGTRYRDSYSIDVLVAHQLVKGAVSWFMGSARRGQPPACTQAATPAICRSTRSIGRLFAPASAPLADRRDLDDEAARRALVSITTRSAVDGSGQQRISHRDLGVEQLGARYETLLDYTPVLDDSPRGRKAPAVSLRTGSGLRKASGTFTPRNNSTIPGPPYARPVSSRRVARGDTCVSGFSTPRWAAARFSSQPARIWRRRTSGTRSDRKLPGASTSARANTARSRAHHRRTMPVRRGHQPDGRAVGAAVVMAGYACGRSAAQLSRSSSSDRRQSGWRVAERAPTPTHHAPPIDSEPAALCRRRRSRRCGCAMHCRSGSRSQSRPTTRPLKFGRRSARSPHSIDPDTPLSKWKRAADLWCACWFSSRAGELGVGIPGADRRLLRARVLSPTAWPRAIPC